MGFCRRCGDIVSGVRCKCGGTPVAPVVKWNQGESQTQDKWSRTYVTNEKSPPRPAVPNDDKPTDPTLAALPSTTPSRRFPRPASSSQTTSVTLGSRVSAHIASVTTSRLSDHDAPSASPNGAAGILPNPNNGSELAKVYGSVLQPKETLATYHCAMCSTQFTPDATIYPDPSSLSPSGADLTSGTNTRFLCRLCFVDNGGSKGGCASCGRTVLILKSEGGFIENTGRVWHKNCFRCEGCFKYIGDNPMVDLLGKPCCTDCFGTCLERSGTDSPRKTEEPRSNLGGVKRTDKDKEGSPALEELEQRLGIFRARDSTSASHAPKGSLGSSSSRIPTSARYTHRSTNSADSTLGVDRLAARMQMDSLTAIRPAMTGEGSSSTRIWVSSDSSTPDSRERERDITLSSRGSHRHSDTNTGSYVPGSPARRDLDGYKALDPDMTTSSSSARLTKSPRYSSSTIKPTEEAIEEMKNRFLRQTSPSRSSASTSSTTTTSRRRPASRVRGSGPITAVHTGDISPREQTSSARISRTLTGSSLTPSVRSHIRRDRTGDSAYTVRRDRTGDAALESLYESLASIRASNNDTGLGAEVASQLGSPESTGPMSRLPGITSAATSDLSSGIGLGLRTGLADSSSKGSYADFVLSTPDLAADVSDTNSNSQPSAPSTPPSVSPPALRGSSKQEVISHPTGNSGRIRRSSDTFARNPTHQSSKSLPNARDLPSPIPLSPDARCAKCNLQLFSTKHGGKFVTVPEEPASSGVPPKTYHVTCFRCNICDGLFEERDGGRAVFVRAEGGPCHIECAPPERMVVHQVPSTAPQLNLGSSIPATPSKPDHTTTYTVPLSSSRYERPLGTAHPTTTTFPRFGGSMSCPGCSRNVSPMERGVVPGPQGTRWHQSCLLCGGKEAKGRRKEGGKPGCGKQLDSAAKTDSNGRVWCRECLLLLPPAMRNPQPVVRAPLIPSFTGGRGIAPQHTGATTIARQFTGVGGTPDVTLPRQLTGGATTARRQSSPTKQHDGPRPGRTFPRPRSVIGVRSTKSEGEGRGMFLVRQLTGGNGGFSGNDYGL
ncbi:uncharacterized protein LAESUDRAFT_725596 [Laetiporus sulphureus 93-53]|uniref:LIM zinc-binding domain-containing protein n=1 Tax=Laetiporus sulphureus 93-53 TaxID=1314785 RepID=A0A165EE10_9APHY|nr:uncharacterized protein LAESUDRAFT_725596 [Laetiporus sulphureus 93-53]KZT06837.1 hypothetical protein LAESUDRAFT_725596 [Laetiporus sulphureus 93-53]